jgi:hypothetical protein
MLTQERLKEVLHYDPDTGIWIWLVSDTHRVRVGDRAGGIKETGYRTIGIDGKRYRSARLAVLYMTGKWPKEKVDHENLNKADDSWNNLREATHGENQRNKPARRDNKLGVKGVCKYFNKFEAQIQADGKRFRSRHNTKEEAQRAFEEMAKLLHGDFARTK